VNKFEGKLKMYKHLEDIRNKLWSEDGKSRVSVMVGAGFSLNAEKLDESLESMSLWSDLKSKIAEELKHINISEETDVLSLAQIYEEEYGRTNLDELIKQAIPDQNYEPGELHRSLLRLPWADVYTTNYDTLLERTLPYVYERSYQVIYDINDIPSSVSPRIIKLHGSFPSKRPFIFTKKDYDTYEQKFTPFVNMVQQSIMETTFVLIGFSGNDPNFEKWTKWVRDNLGEHMPKIYMLAYNEQKNESLLRERNITLIDFKDVYKETENKDVYKEMFKDIFDFLSYKDRKDKKEWPYKPFPYSSSNLDKVLQTFKYNRESYPGWLIVPDIIKKKNKGNIELSKDNILRHIRDEDDISIKISIIYELVWVYEKFQIPLDFHFQNFLKKFVDEILKDEVLLSKINVNLFAFIVLRLVKEARLDFNEDEYIKYTKSLKKIRLTNEQQNQLIYEEIQFKLSNFDFEEVRNKVNKWKLSKKDLDWSLKKAIILLKIGEKQRAIEELEETLERVRQLITISRNNYHLLSLEGLILVNLIQLNHHYSLTNSKDRLNYLESKLCNPLKELDFMYSRIKPFAKKSGVFVKKGFDPNKIKRTYSFTNFFESEVIDSYSILMISEEWGMYLTNSQTINEAIKNLEIIYPFYSWVKFIQVGNLENIDDFFSRETIYKSNASSLSNLFKIIFNGIKNKENTKVELLLEILSRLYFALTKDEKKKADNLILELYKDRDLYKVNIYSIIKVLASLFQRIIFDKDQNERAEFFSKVLELPIIGDPHGELKDIDLDENYFFDPSYKFEFDLDDAEGIYIEFNQKEIDRLLKILDGEKSNIRDAALSRLIKLILTKNLDREIDFRVRESIRNIILKEKSGFSYYFLESFLVQLTQDEKLQNDYIQKRIQQPIPKSYHNGVVSIGNALQVLLQDLSNVFPRFIRTKKEPHILVSRENYLKWLEQFFYWWEDQESWLLKGEKDELFGENQDLLYIVIFLKNSFLANIPLEYLSEKQKEKISEIYFKIDKNQHNIALLLIPVLLRLKIISEEELEKTFEGILDNNVKISKSAISSIYDLAVFKKYNEIDLDLSELKKEILYLFKYRKENTLLEVIRTLRYIINYAPETFDENEYLLIIKVLTTMYNDLTNGFYENSSISNDFFEIFSESTGLAAYIYKLGKSNYCNKLQHWKRISQENRLPEVRKYAPLFEK
jgi:hypothetical protein